MSHRCWRKTRLVCRYPFPRHIRRCRCSHHRPVALSSPIDILGSFVVQLRCSQRLHRRQHDTGYTTISLHPDTIRNTEWCICYTLHLHSRHGRHTCHCLCVFHCLYIHRCRYNPSMASNFFLQKKESIPVNVTRFILYVSIYCCAQPLTIMVWWTTDFLLVNA